MLHVHTNLMRPAGEQTTQNERIVAKLLQHFEKRASASPSFNDGHLFSMHRMPPDWGDNLTLFHRELSLANSQIIFFDFPTGKLPTQTLMGEIVLGYHQTSTGLLIEPMDNPRSQFSADAAERRAVV